MNTNQPHGPLSSRIPGQPTDEERSAATRDIFTALTHRDLPGVVAALDTGADPNALGSRSVMTSRTPLFAAAFTGQHDCIALLLARGADAKTIGYDGETALLAAAYYGCSKCVALLIPASDIHAKRISQRVDALMMACACGHVECATALLHAGADPHARSHKGRTPLMVVAQQGIKETTELLQLLLPVSDLLATDFYGETALSLARASGSPAASLLEAYHLVHEELAQLQALALGSATQPTGKKISL